MSCPATDALTESLASISCERLSNTKDSTSTKEGIALNACKNDLAGRTMLPSSAKATVYSPWLIRIL